MGVSSVYLKRKNLIPSFSSYCLLKFVLFFKNTTCFTTYCRDMGKLGVKVSTLANHKNQSSSKVHLKICVLMTFHTGLILECIEKNMDWMLLRKTFQNIAFEPSPLNSYKTSASIKYIAFYRFFLKPEKWRIKKPY